MDIHCCLLVPSFLKMMWLRWFQMAQVPCIRISLKHIFWFLCSPSMSMSRKSISRFHSMPRLTRNLSSQRARTGLSTWKFFHSSKSLVFNLSSRKEFMFQLTTRTPYPAGLSRCWIILFHGFIAFIAWEITIARGKFPVITHIRWRGILKVVAEMVELVRCNSRQW